MSITPTLPATTFKEIIFATDFSECSNHALAYAKAMAKWSSARLHVIHVIRPDQHIAVPEGEWFDYGTKDWELNQAKACGEALIREGYSADVKCLYGSVAEEIRDATTPLHAELVVAGSHAPSGMNRLLLGSTAEALAAHTTIPLLIVGPNVAPLASQEWSLTDIVCGVRISASSPALAIYAYRLAQSVGASFSLFCFEDPSHPTIYAKWRVWESEFLQGVPMKELEFKGICSISLEDDPGHALVEYARRRCTSMIVMEPDRSLFDSPHLHRGPLSHVLGEACCPVLTFRTTAAP